MSLRQKLLLVFSLTVVLAVAAVAWIVSLRTREAFAEADRKHTAAVVEQFRHEAHVGHKPSPYEQVAAATEQESSPNGDEKAR